jgi:hypothetical protein
MRAAALSMTEGRQKFFLIAAVIMIVGLVFRAPAWCANLVGMVSNNRGEPVPGVAVSVVNSAGIDSGKAVSDARGRYAISNLAPGIYKLGSSGQWVMSYIGDRGLTVNWGLAPRQIPVAIAKQGTALDSPVTLSAAPAKISPVRAKPVKSRSRDDDDSDENSN